MTDLQRLTREGAAEITEAFATGEEEVPVETFERHSESVPEGYEIDFEPVRSAVEEAVEDYDEEDEEMDAVVAPALHRQLDVPRRVATDRRMWYRLATVELRDYVRHRWGYDGAIQEKFRGDPDDIDSNAVLRLWWIAELTEVPSDAPWSEAFDLEDEYELTREALKFRSISNRIVDNRFHKVQPVAAAFVDQFRDQDSSAVSDAPDPLNTALGLLPAEGWVSDNPVTFVENVKERMRTD
jgi:hypothetical protein